VESLGEKLRTTREGKDISFDQAGKDTKIAIRYLQALEQENFSCFPGEAYITGFLRNYGAYLDLDVQELLSLYRALKIQEQPIPVEQLLKRPSPLPKIAIGTAVVLLVLGLAGGVVFLIIDQPKNTGVVSAAPKSPVEYTMSGDTFEKQFFRGDTILIPVGSDRVKIELLNLNEAATVQTPGGQIVLDLGQEAGTALDSNTGLRIKAVDFAKNNPDMGVRLHFELYNSQSLSDSRETPADTASITAQSVSTVIFSSPNPYPFTLQSNFQGYCMFRWEILLERDRRERKEQYFQRSEELSIQAQNGIRIWTSNAQAAKFQVIGGGRTVPVEIGGAGEVVVADIRWVRDDENRYRLIVSRLESGNT